MERSGSWFRGRPVTWDPAARAVEHDRQRWVSAAVAGMNELVEDLAVDPAQAYQLHRAEYEKTGDPVELQLMLAYVT